MIGWPTKPLGEVADFERGLTYSKTDEVAQSRNGVLRANNIDLTTKLLDLTDIRYIADTVQVPPTKKVRKGSLLICTASGSRSHLGKVALIEDDYDLAFGGFMGLITAGHAVGSRFLYYLLTSERFQEKLDSLAGGTNINNLKFKDIADFSIPIPSLEEQRRIVAVLDEAFAAIATATANAEKNLANARELFVAQRERMLRIPGAHWKASALSDLCTIKHGFAFKSEHFCDDAEHTLLTPGNFFEAGGYRDRGAKQKYYNGPIPKGFVLNGGDLLVAMTEQAAGLLGSPILVPATGLYLHNQRLGLVQPRSGVEWANEFFFHVFNTVHLRDHLHRTGTGQKVRHTSPSKIGDVVVHFPSTVQEQLAVASQLDDLWSQVEQLSDVYSERLEKLSLLKQSLLHRAFTGELTDTMPETIAA